MFILCLHLTISVYTVRVHILPYLTRGCWNRLYPLLHKANAMTMTLRGSENFIWSMKHSLGAGSIGTVYRGRNKRSGRLVAVKQFRRENDQARRELDVASRLNHKNIVSILDVERESTLGDRVLVMEFCPRGSLFTLLSQPEYMRGLPEDLMLKLIFNLSGAMKYLHDSKMAHRDIKPGNLLCSRGRDGRTVFKLADFGTWRDMSSSSTEAPLTFIEGTEEYIYPSLFCLMADEDSNRKYAYSPIGADRWSFGVTIYEAATGRLPFVVQGGRGNRQAMKRLLEGIQDDVISGYISNTGTPVYEKKLPITTKLSRWLSDYVTHLLQGVLRYKDTQWGDNRLFDDINKLRPKQTMYLFCVDTYETQRFYMGPNDKFSQLAREIKRIFGIDVSFEDIMVNGLPLSNLVTERTVISRYPETCETRPISICINLHKLNKLTHPISLDQHVFTEQLHFEEDVRTAKSIMADVLFLSHQLSQLNIASRSTDALVLSLWSHLMSENTHRDQKLASVERQRDETRAHIELIKLVVSKGGAEVVHTVDDMIKTLDSLKLTVSVTPLMTDIPLGVLILNNNHMMPAETQCKCHVAMQSLIDTALIIISELREQRQQNRLDENATQLQHVLRQRMNQVQQRAKDLRLDCHRLMEEKHTQAGKLLREMARHREEGHKAIAQLEKQEQERQNLYSKCNEIIRKLTESSGRQKSFSFSRT